jgi:GTPase Era involved in 16S rRNA processing
LLLKKMLEEHSNKDMLLEETVKETILNSSHESIPKYIDSGIRQLNEHADEYIEMLNWNQL